MRLSATMNEVTLGYVLIGVGFLILCGELAVPTHGVLIATGIFVDIVGVGLVFYYGGRYKGFVTLAAVSLMRVAVRVAVTITCSETDAGASTIRS